MVTLQNLGIHFSGEFLFDGASMMFTKQDKVGLVGRNGCGKSTLLKALAGKQAFEGDISKSKDVRVGYLEQDLEHLKGKTVYEETKEAFKEVMVLLQQREEYTAALGTREDYESDSYAKLIDDLNQAEDRIRLLGGDTLEKDITRVLKGLGFVDEDLHKDTGTFSGGWQMRIVLAKLLLQRPELLLLDEPTNHLDIESIQWLEIFLKQYEGAVILVSHDRAFLDNVTNRTVEINSGKVFDYRSSYTQYLEQRAINKEQQEAQAKNQAREIKQIERNIEKFRYKASKAKFAQTLIKKLDKIDRIELDEDDIKAMKLRFPEGLRPGRVTVKAEAAGKRFGDLQVLKDIDFAIERGERIAFVGKNGEGKTTLSRMIVGELDGDGEVSLGHNVELSYYAQHQADALGGESTVFEVIDNVAVGDMRTRVRDMLGAFLFSGETVHKKVKVLSGGERARLALCKMLLEPSNVLVLDEPTNHLDMISKDVLKQALINYSGTLIVVSHDREFLEGLTDKVWEFKNQNIKEHIGDVYEFLKQNNIETFREFENKKDSSANQANAQLSTSNNKERYAQKKELEKEKRSLNKQSSNAEKRIEKLEAAIAGFEQELANPNLYNDKIKFATISEQHLEAQEDLMKQMELWEQAQTELETIQSQLDQM